MLRENHTLARRWARAMLSLIRSQVDRGLSDAELSARREEVNREFAELGNEAFAEALQSLYKLAEADARRKQIELRRASSRQSLY